MRIALDGMGGDHAPEEIVVGAAQAIERGLIRPSQLLIAGKADEIQAELDKCHLSGVIREFDTLDQLPDPDDSPSDDRKVTVVPASEVVDMNESPSAALRQKRDSSLAVATRLVKARYADAVVSAGNTGAAVASAVMSLKSLEGIHRPGIAVTIEGEDGPFTVIDVGANIAPKPIHLLHYGIMGSCLMSVQHGKENPRVALLNIGGEEGKGNELAKEVQGLFRDSGLNFVGNIEGTEVFLGACDVVVCEGFVGNVLLKLSEGLATHLLRVVKEELVRAGVRPSVLETSLGRIVQRTDYSEYGGALLLGVEGTVTICHGRSESRAIANAIRLSADAVDKAVNDKLVAAIHNQQVDSKASS